jgi:dienelactone hydrolase
MSEDLKLELSPSLYHRHAMESLKPSLSYSGGDVAVWQQKLRTVFGELIGFYPVDYPATETIDRWRQEHPAGTELPRVPLNPRSIWKREFEIGTIEKFVYTSEPHCDVPAYFCTPKNATPPYPLMICLQGHSTGMHVSINVEREDETKPRQAEGDRDFALGCMKRGVAALCIEQRSFGERREQVQERISEHGCHDATMHALLIGRTMMGERTWDVDRGIDYIATRPEIDMNRIGVMGNSGGATITIASAALLPRIRFAMPSCGFAMYKSSIGGIYHCADNYVPRILRYAEMGDVLGLFAPKPLVVVAGKTDGIFPIDSVREAFKQVQTIYRAAGAENMCHLVEGPEGHRFYADLAWEKMIAYTKA